MPCTFSGEQVGVHVFMSAWLHDLHPLIPTNIIRTCTQFTRFIQTISSPLLITVWSVRLFKFLTFFGFCSLLINFLAGRLPCDRLSCHCELSMYSVRLTFLRVLHIQSCFGDRLFNVHGSKLWNGLPVPLFLLLLLDVNVQTSINWRLVHGWWYVYAVQRMATPPFNKMLATNGVVKQQLQIKTY